MIADFLVAWMKQEAGVTAILGSGDSIAFYPQHGVQNRDTFPRATYLEVTDTPKNNLTGPCGTNTVNVQIDCWSRGSGGATVAETLAWAIAGDSTDPKLNGYRGTLGGVFVQASLLRGGMQKFEEEPEDGSDDWTYRVMLSFDITYNDH